MTSVCDLLNHGLLSIGYWSYESQNWPINAIFPSSGRIHSIIRINHMEACKAHWEKSRRNCTRMLRVILKKSLKQHPTKPQLYGHLPPISKTIQIRRTRYVGRCWGSNNEIFHMYVQVLDKQQELIYNSSVQTQYVVKKTSGSYRWKRQMARERERERGGEFAQTSWHYI